MKLAILDADHVAEELVEEHGEYSAMFKRLLSHADPTLEFSVFPVIDDNFPDNLDAFDGFLITGSKFSAYDQEPWIARLKKLIQEIYDFKKPLVGICFGHQVIAQALGGRTEKAKQGWGVGAHGINLYESPEWLTESLYHSQYTLLVSHQDQVVKLPVGATLLAGSEFCPNAMYQMGDRVLTFQGHPEFSKAYSRALMNKRREIIGEERYLRGLDSLQQTIDGDLIADWIVAFYRYALKH